MADVLVFLTSLTLILLIGIISISLSKRFKLPLPLILFVLGALLGSVSYNNRPIIELGGDVLSAFSLIALVVILFDSTSNIKLYNFDKSMKDSLKFFLIALIVNTIVMSYAVQFFFEMKLFAAIIFSILISCIEYLVIFPRHHVPKNKLMQFLKDESNLSCTFMLFIPFLIISFVQLLEVKVASGVSANLLILLTNVLVGIGAGLVVALILFNLMNKSYLEKISSYVLAAGLLLAFVVSEKMGGNGFIAVAAIGFIFGNVFLKEKHHVLKQENLVYSVLEIFMFIIVGIVIGIPFSLKFIELSFGLFLLYLVIRFFISQLFLRDYNSAERLELAFFIPKGLATVTIAFALLNYSFPGVILLIQLLLAFFVYSIVFDTILDKVGFYRHR